MGPVGTSQGPDGIVNSVPRGVDRATVSRRWPLSREHGDASIRCRARRVLVERGVSRRAFLKFSAAMATALALPMSYAPRIATAVQNAPRIPVIWLEGQDCAGNTEGFLRASHPTVADLILDVLSVDYHETIMAAAGKDAEAARDKTIRDYPNGYIVGCRRLHPAGRQRHPLHGRRHGHSRASSKRSRRARWRSSPWAPAPSTAGFRPPAGGPTGAIGVSTIVPNATLVNLPGCPMNVQNLTATIVHYLTFGSFPATDALGRPLFAYGQLIHDQCERRAHFESGRVRPGLGGRGPAEGLLPLQDGLQGSRDVRQLPDGAVQRRHELAGQDRPRLRRLHDAALLGPDESLLPAARRPRRVSPTTSPPTRSA